MIIQKLSLVILFIPLLFIGERFSQNSGSGSKTQTGTINIDSVLSAGSSAGWNSRSLEDYRNYLLNFPVNYKDEADRISRVEEPAVRSLLNALLLKRKGQYNEAFDTLYACLKLRPAYFMYYEELTAAAKSAGKLPVLRSALQKKDNFPKEQAAAASAFLEMAEGNFKYAAELFSGIVNSNPAGLNALYYLSYAERYSGDYGKALQHILKMIELAEGNPWITAKGKLAAGSLHLLSGNSSRAEKFYTEAFKLSEASGDRISLSKAYMNLGIIKDLNGSTGEARRLFLKALSISSAVNEPETAAMAYSELGVSYSFTGELTEAKGNYLKGYELYKRLRNNQRLALVSNNLGNLYVHMFDYYSAVKYYEEGLSFAGGDVRARILNLTGLGDVYANLADYSKALKYYKEAHKLSEQINDIAVSADISRGLGAMSLNLNRPAMALEHFRNAQIDADAQGDVYTSADVLHKTALAMAALDSAEQAESLFLKSAAQASAAGDPYTEAMAYGDMAMLLIEEGNTKKALELLNKAGSIAEENDFLYLTAEQKLIAGAAAEKENNFTAAGAAYKKCVEISRSLKVSNLEIEALYRLGKLYAGNRLYPEAEVYFKTAADIIDRVSGALFQNEDIRIGYFSAKKDIYDDYAALSLETGRYEQAFTLTDRSRSRSLLQNLNNIKLNSLIADKELLEKLHEYDYLLYGSTPEHFNRDSVLTQYQTLRSRLTRLSPESDYYLNNRRTASLHEIQSRLNAGEYLLLLTLNGSGSVFFAVSNDAFKTVKLNITEAETSALIRQLSPYYGSFDKNEKSYFNQDLFAFNSQTAYTLYSRLLQPVLSGIPKGSSLIFSLPAQLSAVPLEILVTVAPDGSAYSYSDKKYLIDDYSIAYTPSPSVFLRQQQNSYKNSGKVLIAGDPLIDSRNEGFAERRGLLEETGGVPRSVALLPLKYSSEEMNGIGSIIHADNILRSEDATETNFKADAELSRIIHLSTHSFLFNGQPVIFFSNYNDKTNDGFLEAAEIVQLRLNSDLVVLSSCSSGMGKIDEAEGIIGMSKALFEAGAKSTLVSLWEVNDKYTSKFMELFYEELSGGSSKTDALRNAKLKFIKSYSANPYYWGAFVLTGNTGNIQLKAPQTAGSYIIISLLLITAAAVITVVIRRKNRTV